jgi:hypothetical protein
VWGPCPTLGSVIRLVLDEEFWYSEPGPADVESLRDKAHQTLESEISVPSQGSTVPSVSIGNLGSSVRNIPKSFRFC